jgi:hypothetical protein
VKDRLLELLLLLAIHLLMLLQKQSMHQKLLEQWVLLYLFAHFLDRLHQIVWVQERWNLALEL